MRAAGVLVAVFVGGVGPTQDAPTTTSTSEPEPTTETTGETEPTTEPEPEPDTQTELVLGPSEGPVGTTVTATQDVGPCQPFRVRWEGRPIGTADEDGDPTGQVTFAVPEGADPGDYTVVATCGSDTTGSATFTVTESGVPTSGSPTTSTSVPPVPETIEECREQASEALAHLTYEPRRQMVVGRSYDLGAVLSLGDVPPDITFESPTTVEELPGLQCTVDAQLTGSDFEIMPDGPKPQSFIGTHTLTWEWQVRPRRVGDDLELTLRIQAEVVQGGETVPGPTILHESTIDVDAEPESWWTSLTGWLEDVFGHPMVPILIVPLVGAAIAYGRRRLRSHEAPGPTHGTAPPAPPPAGG